MIAVTSAIISLAPLVCAAQDRGDDAVELKFGAFFKHPVGPRGLELGPALTAADGREVRIVGYMVAQEQPTPGRFMLTPRPVRMSEHADGDADDLPPATLTVVLHESQRDRVIAHAPGLIALRGRLEVGAQVDAAARVSWVRLYLSPDATALPRASTDAQPAHSSTIAQK